MSCNVLHFLQIGVEKTSPIYGNFKAFFSVCKIINKSSFAIFLPLYGRRIHDSKKAPQRLCTKTRR